MVAMDSSSQPSLSVNALEFLSAKCGDFVVISASPNVEVDWWVGVIINLVGNSADPMVNTLFQVIDIDTGNVFTVNADIVRGII